MADNDFVGPPSPSKNELRRRTFVGPPTREEFEKGMTGTKEITPEVKEFFEGLPKKPSRSSSGGGSDFVGPPTREESKKRSEEEKKRKAEEEQKRRVEEEKRKAEEKKKQEKLRKAVEQEKIKQEERTAIILKKQRAAKVDTKLPVGPPSPVEATPKIIGQREYVTQRVPAFGTVMPEDVAGFREELQIRDIEPDFDRGIVRRAEEYIPIAGIPLTALREPAYLPDSESVEKFNELIKSPKPGAAKELTDFLREQQAEYKKDVGEYNELSLRLQAKADSVTQEDINKVNEIANKLNIEQFTLRGLLQERTDKAAEEGKKVEILGLKVDPKTARRALIASKAGYKVSKELLAFEAAAALGAPLVAKTGIGARVLKSTQKASPVLVPLIASGISVGAGVQEYKKYGDIGDAIAAGAGAGLGFLTPLGVSGAGKALTTQRNLKNLNKVKPISNNYVIKDGDDLYLISTSTRNTPKLTSINRATYKIIPTKEGFIIRRGEGFLTISEAKTGKVLSGKQYEFGGFGEKLKSPIRFRTIKTKIDGKPFDIKTEKQLKDLAAQKGRIVIDTGDKVVSKPFLTLSRAQGDKTISLSQKLEKGLVKRTDEVELIKDIQTGELVFYPKYSSVKTRFTPQTGGFAQEISKEQLALMTGRTKVELSVLTRGKPSSRVKTKDLISSAADNSGRILKGKGGSKEILNPRSKTSRVIYEVKPQLTDRPVTSAVETVVEEAALGTLKLPSPPTISPTVFGPITTTIPRKKEAEKVDSMITTIQKTKPARIDTAKDLVTGIDTSFEQDISPVFDVGFDQTIKQIQQQQIQRITTPRFIEASESPALEKPVEEKTPKPPRLDFEFEKPKSGKVIGYDAYILRKATKKSKSFYQKINKRGPLTQQSALSAMARRVDQEIPARGKIERAQNYVQQGIDKVGKIIPKGKRKVKAKVLDTKDKYWRNNKQKFRTYSGKKKVPLKGGVFIEKQKYRLDSPKEKRQIRIAKLKK